MLILCFRDIKARNIVLNYQLIEVIQRPELLSTFKVKLCDFGLCVEMVKEDDHLVKCEVMSSASGTASHTGKRTHSIVGTPCWKAPECFRIAASASYSGPIERVNFDEPNQENVKADIYGAATVLYSCLMCEEPYRGYIDPACAAKKHRPPKKPPSKDSAGTRSPSSGTRSSTRSSETRSGSGSDQGNTKRAPTCPECIEEYVINGNTPASHRPLPLPLQNFSNILKKCWNLGRTERPNAEELYDLVQQELLQSCRPCCDEADSLFQHEPAPSEHAFVNVFSEAKAEFQTPKPPAPLNIGVNCHGMTEVEYAPNKNSAQCALPTITEDGMNQLSSWLMSKGLGEYNQNFFDAGFDQLETILHLDEAKHEQLMEEVKMTKFGHQETLRQALTIGRPLKQENVTREVHMK